MVVKFSKWNSNNWKCSITLCIIFYFPCFFMAIEVICCLLQSRRSNWNTANTQSHRLKCSDVTHTWFVIFTLSGIRERFDLMTYSGQETWRCKHFCSWHISLQGINAILKRFHFSLNFKIKVQYLRYKGMRRSWCFKDRIPT